MTIEVEVSPELEASLTAEAAVLGMDLKKYAGKVLQERKVRFASGNYKLTSEEFHAMLNELAEGSEVLPRLPTSAFSRESIYEEHL
jgi:hypothetical protein